MGETYNTETNPRVGKENMKQTNVHIFIKNQQRNEEIYVTNHYYSSILFYILTKSLEMSKVFNPCGSPFHI